MKPWKELAAELPVGRTARRDCPQCGEGTNTNAAIVSHSIKTFSIKCFACDFNEYEFKGALTLHELKRMKGLNDEAQRFRTREIELPTDYTNKIPLAGRLWLYSCGITPSLWQDYRIGWSERLERVVLPVYDNAGKLIWFQLRAVHKEQRPKYLQPSADRTSVLFITGEENKGNGIAIVVEDYASAVRVADSGFTAISLLGTKFTTEHLAKISEFDNFIIWLDSDRAGLKGSLGLRKAVSLIAQVTNLVTEKDPKKYSRQQIQEFVCTTLKKCGH